jgi:hypothetical protein
MQTLPTELWNQIGTLVTIEDLCALRETHSFFSWISPFRVQYNSVNQKMNQLTCERYFETQLQEVASDPQEYWIQFLSPITNDFITIKHIIATHCVYFQIATNIYHLTPYIQNIVTDKRGWSQIYKHRTSEVLTHFGRTFIGYQGRQACPFKCQGHVYYFEFEEELHPTKIISSFVQLLSEIIFQGQLERKDWITFEVHSSTLFYQLVNQNISDVIIKKKELLLEYISPQTCPDLKKHFVTKEMIYNFLQ